MTELQKLVLQSRAFLIRRHVCNKVPRTEVKKHAQKITTNLDRTRQKIRISPNTGVKFTFVEGKPHEAIFVTV